MRADVVRGKKQGPVDRLHRGPRHVPSGQPFGHCVGQIRAGVAQETAAQDDRAGSHVQAHAPGCGAHVAGQHPAVLVDEGMRLRFAAMARLQEHRRQSRPPLLAWAIHTRDSVDELLHAPDPEDR